MSAVNQYTILGNVGGDPQIRSFENGGKLATFSVATTEVYKDRQGNKQEATEWHNVVVSGKMVDTFEQYVKKGHQIYLQGKHRTRKYNDANGVTRYVSELFVRSFMLLKNGQSNEGGNRAPEYDSTYGMDQGQQAPPPGEDDDLPF